MSLDRESPGWKIRFSDLFLILNMAFVVFDYRWELKKNVFFARRIVRCCQKEFLSFCNINELQRVGITM
jgi:hypothetical protein